MSCAILARRPCLRATGALFHEAKVLMLTREALEEKPGRRKAKRAPSVQKIGQGDVKAIRTRLAQEEGVSAYIVFSNAALADMVDKAPQTKEEFLEAFGGKIKAMRYGEAFLQMILTYLKHQS